MGKIVREHVGDGGSRSGINLQHDVGNLSAAVASTKSVSQKPWSNYQPSDYTIEQYHAACLIHNHDGPPTSKTQCKLPIKTPDGTVNKNGVFAAAAALAGARGGVNASSDQKASAAKTLINHYKKIGATPPPALTQMAHSIEVGEFLEHHGIKGQKWGIRNPRNRVRSGTAKAASRTKFQKPASRLSDTEIQKRIKRMELEKRYNELNKGEKAAGKKYLHDILQNSGKTAAGAVVGTVVAAVVKKALSSRLG